jgi:hypothetical protein
MKSTLLAGYPRFERGLRKFDSYLFSATVCYTCVMPKHSILRNKEALQAAIDSSSTSYEILNKLGLRAAGGNYKQLKLWANVHKLVLPVMTGQQKTMKARAFNSLPYEEVFCENSTYYNRGGLKTRLRKIWVEWKCSDCGLEEIWNGKALTLQLEHKNGVWNDNRLENLTLLCPNCHSQTDTFAGRKTKII